MTTPNPHYPRLNKAKPYSTCHPPVNDCYYEQNGFYYNRNFHLVETALDAAAKEQLRLHVLKSQAAEESKKATDAFYKKAGVDPKTLPKQETVKPAEPDRIDLIAWAKNLKQYDWFRVVKEAKEQYSFAATDARSLIEFMIREGKISEDEARPA